MRESVYDRYYRIVDNIEEIPKERVSLFVKELTRRHLRGWRIPNSTYLKLKNLLYYKESLERNSPYYIDLLKIENTSDLKTVIINLYNTIKIKEGI